MTFFLDKILKINQSEIVFDQKIFFRQNIYDP